MAQAFWKRYPNPNSTHVLSEDILSREVKNGVLYTKRLLTKTGFIPKWGRTITSKNVIKIVEESMVDPHKKTLTTYTRNVGETKVMTVIEKVVYQVSEENPEWTVAKRSAWINSQIYGFSKPIQAFGMERFKKGCTKAAHGFNYVLAHMYPQNVQFMNPTLAQMGFANIAIDGMTQKTSITTGLHNSLHDKAEKMKDAAKKATDIAKNRATPIYAACESNKS